MLTKFQIISSHCIFHGVPLMLFVFWIAGKSAFFNCLLYVTYSLFTCSASMR